MAFKTFTLDETGVLIAAANTVVRSPRVFDPSRMGRTTSPPASANWCQFASRFGARFETGTLTTKRSLLPSEGEYSISVAKGIPREPISTTARASLDNAECKVASKVVEAPPANAVIPATGVTTALLVAVAKFIEKVLAALILFARAVATCCELIVRCASSSNCCRWDKFFCRASEINCCSASIAFS
ncbi:hypothetical protein D3C72_1527730 [compost metagenome]